jgi:hypothetical protein
MLKGWQIVCAGISWGAWLCEAESAAPLGRGLIYNDIPGVKTPGLVLKSLRDAPPIQPHLSSTSTKRQTPNAERRTPNAKRQTPFTSRRPR